jgi:hypothetical protein
VSSHKVLDHLGDLPQVLLPSRDKARIGGGAEQHRALPHAAGSLKLDVMSIGLDPFSSAHTGAAVVDRLVARLAQVEPALRFLHGVRIRLLVKAVRGDRDWCGAALQRHALQFETPGVQCGEDGIAPPWHAADRGAFDDLRHVHGRRKNFQPRE